MGKAKDGMFKEKAKKVKPEKEKMKKVKTEKVKKTKKWQIKEKLGYFLLSFIENSESFSGFHDKLSTIQVLEHWIQLLKF